MLVAQERVSWFNIERGKPFIFPALLLFFGFYYLSDYLNSTLTILLAGAVAIASTVRKSETKRPYRFAIVATALLVLTWLVPVKTLLYLSAGFALLYWVETRALRVHFLGVIALLLSSPAFQYASGAFSFPIRLQLTKIVGALFSLVSPGVELKGNTIFYNGQEFAVDPACMGIHMLSISILLGIALLGLLQRKAGKKINWKIALLYLAMLFVLNLVANVLRIILLVQFAVPPDAIMHDIIGLLCLLLYVCVPACYLAKWLVSKAVAGKSSNTSKRAVGFGWLLPIALLLLGQRVVSVDTYAKFESNYAQVVNGYQSSVFAPGILKLVNKQSLVYVKFIRGFYDTEHNPSMCWKGSGYMFKELARQSIAGREVYTALLCRNNEKIYTAWWYGNNRFSTTSQWEWRWNLLKGAENYAVINVTAASQEGLAAEVQKMLHTKTLEPLFKQ
ncbi:MAG TPA: exosortase N [Flavisolibacter sp.]|nr:exosortase N [Flavisolibacter sp.]